MTAPLEIWVTKQCADATGVSVAHWLSLAADPEAKAIMPQPFGRAGNSKLYDPVVVRAAIPKIREWVEGSQARARAKQRLALKKQDEEFERRQALYAGSQR